MSDDFNNWSALALALQEGAMRAVDNTAEIAVGNIQQQIEANNQVVTGEMRDSAYAKSQRFSTYQSSEHALDEIPAPADALEADVAMAANYSIFPEFGTRFQSAKPFFTPGMEKTKTDFDAQIEYYVLQALEDAAKL
jgi:HK97 gp10 family phage protein